MSKKNRNKGAAKPEAPKTEATVTAPVAVTEKATVPMVCRVKPGLKLRGARDAWYAKLLEYEGKPLADFVAATDQTGDAKGKAPSLPKSGIAESPSGWVSWFKRQGILTLEAPATAEGEQASA